MNQQRSLSVLFVDDEPAILKLIPLLLADMRDEWRMEFAENAAQGLGLLSETQFDVVVSDLQMPGQSGIDFLKEVRDRCPTSARIIYSSAFDQAEILKCAGVAHEFLPKPCSAHALKGTIQRAVHACSLLPNAAMQKRVSPRVSPHF